MVSLPYRSSALDYLAQGKIFDVRRTPSSMGLISEFFRRRAGVQRSLHPTHPILALGSNAEWLVEGHEACIYPCGPGTPFEKLLRSGGKVVFFNVPFSVFTFFHYLEHMVRDELPFPIYDDASFDVPVIDRDGVRRTVTTVAFARDAIQRRRPEVLESWLWRRGVIKRTRVGASVLLLVDLREVERAVEEMMKDGVIFYDLSVPAVAGGSDDPR
jgi:aminoglycoside 3-N-acetyltransferase